jgi:hypothetical protein
MPPRSANDLARLSGRRTLERALVAWAAEPFILLHYMTFLKGTASIIWISLSIFANDQKTQQPV